MKRNDLRIALAKSYGNDVESNDLTFARAQSRIDIAEASYHGTIEAMRSMGMYPMRRS